MDIDSLSAKKDRKHHAQPLEAAQDPDAWLKVETVIALTGFSKTTIRHMEKRNEFPLGERIRPNVIRWRAGVIRAFLRGEWKPDGKPA